MTETGAARGITARARGQQSLLLIGSLGAGLIALLLAGVTVYVTFWTDLGLAGGYPDGHGNNDLVGPSIVTLIIGAATFGCAAP